MQEQLRQALAKGAMKILDLFRDWDEDGDGLVSKREFRKALAALGADAPRSEVDVLFDSLDEDGSGYLTFDEFKRITRTKLGLKVSGGRLPYPILPYLT